MDDRVTGPNGRSPASRDQISSSLTLDRLPGFYERLLDTVQVAVIAADLEGRVLYWNPFAEDLYGWTAGEALGRSVLELKSAPGTEVETREVMALLHAGQTWMGEIVLRRKDRSTFPAHVSAGPMHDQDGVLVGVICTSYDISDRKHAEDEQALLVRELHQAELREERAGEIRRSLLAREEERRKFAAELHDSTQQHLCASELFFAQLEKRAADDPESARTLRQGMQS
jgi:PAS domain S-box-containing protein